MSQNLPTWAIYLGYSLEGDLGTFGSLYLKKNEETVEVWNWNKRAPNMLDMEDVVRRHEYL